MIITYHLHMPSLFIQIFTEYSDHSLADQRQSLGLFHLFFNSGNLLDIQIAFVTIGSDVVMSQGILG